MLDLSEGRPGCQCNGLLPRARLHPRPHAASAFPALHARALGAQLSAGRAADAAAKPAAAQSSLLCTRSGRPTRSPASPGYALPHALLCAPPMPPAALAPPAPSRPRAALLRRGRRYSRRPALSVACRSLAQVLPGRRGRGTFPVGPLSELPRAAAGQASCARFLVGLGPGPWRSRGWRSRLHGCVHGCVLAAFRPC